MVTGGRCCSSCSCGADAFVRPRRESAGSDRGSTISGLGPWKLILVQRTRKDRAPGCKASLQTPSRYRIDASISLPVDKNKPLNHPKINSFFG